MKETEHKMGALTTWMGSEWYDRAKLAEELAAISMEHRLPDFTTPDKRVKMALDQVVGGPGIIVRKMDGGWSAHVEVKGKTHNEYPHTMSASVEEKADGVTITFNPFDERAQEVLRIYNERRHWIAREAVVRMLVGALHEWNCRAIRPGGSVYWVMPNRIEDWTALGRATEKASVTGLTEVYVFRQAVDGDTVRALRTQMRRDVSDWTSKTKDEITKGVEGRLLGKRALQYRCDDAVHMRDSLREYEVLLGETLSDLHDMIDDVSRTGGQAIMMAQLEQAQHTATPPY